MAKKVKQLERKLPTWGGKRRGAGRKPKGARPLVSHARRPYVNGHEPLLVTVKLRPGSARLRKKRMFRAITECLAMQHQSDAPICVTEFAVLNDHAHLLVEARSNKHLSRGMQGLGVRTAKAVNRRLGRRGKVFADRFHARVLKTPTQVRNARRYVLENEKSHAERLGLPPPPMPDPCSSMGIDTFWIPRSHTAPRWYAPELLCIARPRSFLMRTAYR